MLDVPRGPWAEHAADVIANGWTPLPIVVGSKRPDLNGWQHTTREAALASLQTWARQWPGAGVGILCGQVVAIDIDVEDAAHVDAIRSIVQAELGETRFHRIGRAPREVLVYFSPVPIKSRNAKPLDFIASGKQFVAHHIHPDTGKPYTWVDLSPATASVNALPLVTPEKITAAFDKALAYCGKHGLRTTKAGKGKQTALPLTGAAPDLVSSSASVAETPVAQPAVSDDHAGSWRTALDACLADGHTDEIGGVVAKYFAATPIWELSAECLSRDAHARAASKSFDLTSKGRAEKFNAANLERLLVGVVEKFGWRRLDMPRVTAPPRITLKEASEVLAKAFNKAAKEAAVYAIARREACAALEAAAKQMFPADRAAAYEAGGWKLGTFDLVNAHAADDRDRTNTKQFVEGGLLCTRAPLTYIASTPGTGKTFHSVWGVVDFLMAWPRKDFPRVIFYSETHELLKSSAAKVCERLLEVAYDKHTDRYGIVPDAKCRWLKRLAANVHHVVTPAHKGACSDRELQKRHGKFTGAPISKTRTICRRCDKTMTCPTYQANAAPADAGGVYFVSSARLAYESGKFDPFGADFVIVDEDAAKLVTTGLLADQLAGTPIEAAFKQAVTIARANAEAAYKVTRSLQDKRGFAYVDLTGVATADVFAWSDRVDRDVARLTAQVEALLSKKEDKHFYEAMALLPDLMLATAQQKAALACLAAMTARGGIVRPAMLVEFGPCDAVLNIYTPRAGLRRSIATPMIAMDGTPRIGDLLPLVGKRPVTYIGGNVKPGKGVTHIVVPDSFIGNNKLNGDSPQSNIGTFEAVGALLTMLHGKGVSVMQLEGQKNAKENGLADRAATIRETTVGRLHWNNQRGNDEHNAASWQLSVGQVLPPVVSLLPAAIARRNPDAVQPGIADYTLAAVPVECADGSTTATYSWRAGDTIVDHERDRASTDEAIQGLHRSRAIRRTADKPLTLLSVGTEFGAAGLPAHKFVRFSDLKGVTPLQIAAAGGVVPLTPEALARSRLAPLFSPHTGIGAVVKALADHVRKNGLLSDPQTIANLDHLTALLFGSWRPGEPPPPLPTWGIFEGRPTTAAVEREASNPEHEETAIEVRKKYKKEGSEAFPPTSMAVSPNGCTSAAVPAPQGAVWGQRGPRPRWLVRYIGGGNVRDVQAAIEAISGPVRDLKCVGDVTARVGRVQQHILGRLHLGVVPSVHLRKQRARRWGGVEAYTGEVELLAGL